MNHKDIFKFCQDLGCCDACCLRYLGLKNPFAYENIQKFVLKYRVPITENSHELMKENVKRQDVTNSLGTTEDVTKTIDDAKDQVSNNENQCKLITEDGKSPSAAAESVSTTEDATVAVSAITETNDDNSKSEIHETDNNKINIDTNGTESPPAKKRRDDICVTCLGILQETTWLESYAIVKETLEKKHYECQTFACALSAPISTILRERAITLSLSDKFQDYDHKILTPLKEVWKWSFGNQLAQHIGKTLDSGAVSPLLITLNMEYPEDLQELEVLKVISPSLFQTRSQQKKRFTVEFTRRSVEQALEGASLEALKRAWGENITRPRTTARCVSASTAHTPVYLGGRYIKLSRELPQSPWVVGGERVMNSSVQEIIFEPIAKLYGLSRDELEHRLKFMSAGREDVDVRCLGDGRPFAIEITDPRRVLTKLELQQACEEISKGGQVIVKKLVPVTKEDLTQLKKGEETKCKTYEALCIKLSHSKTDMAECDTPVTVTKADIESINSYSNVAGDDTARVVISQRTPIRVLHRRPLLTRTRRILELTATAVPDHPQLFVVRTRTEAGTYIKEWAHGELGRTRPSLGDAVGARVDILALDVAAVDLDWPTNQ